MNDKIKLESIDKRDSLKRIRNAGLGSAVVASVGLSGGWVRPIVNQVVLPAHAMTTSCGEPIITATMGGCSGGVPVDIKINAPAGSPLRILSVPTIVATPATAQGWDTVSGGAVPADISDTVSYDALTDGEVLDELNFCGTPATDVPNSGGVALTKMEITVEYLCPADGTTSTITVDILPQLP